MVVTPPAPPLATRRTWLGWCAGLVVLPAAAGALRSEQRDLFGSPVELLLPADVPRAASDEVMAGLSAMNARWNAWKPGDVDDLNAALRAGRPHVTPPVLIEMIRSATALERRSGGHFNPAIGGLVAAWGFHDDVMRPGKRPRADTLRRWTERRPSLASLDIRGLTVRGHRPGVQLDFGAYAKGIALDWALDRLMRMGLRDGLLNLGGNLAAMGAAGQRAWRVGIRDPHGPGLAACLSLRGHEAVVTSGTYERWRLLDGQRCTHIIDPASGQPANGLDSVTVVHRCAALADAAATALLVAGPARWQAVAQRMGVDRVLAIDRHGRHIATPLWSAHLEPGV
jgi:FAD:protein FMN transferase